MTVPNLSSPAECTPLAEPLPSAHDCLRLCERDTRCRGYTYKLDDGAHTLARHCWLVSIDGGLHKRAEGFASAVCERDEKCFEADAVASLHPIWPASSRPPPPPPSSRSPQPLVPHSHVAATTTSLAGHATSSSATNGHTPAPSAGSHSALAARDAAAAGTLEARAPHTSIDEPWRQVASSGDERNTEGTSEAGGVRSSAFPAVATATPSAAAAPALAIPAFVGAPTLCRGYRPMRARQGAAVSVR